MSSAAHKIPLGEKVSTSSQTLPPQGGDDQIERDTFASSHQFKTLDCRSFWKAGSDDAFPIPSYNLDEKLESGDFERARVHPKFLHSNATSHTWAFGAIAELLDNAVDEICNGATFVKVDKVLNTRDNSPALCFHDDGGGMDPGSIRHCMSLGFSSKKASKTIGQYGNGFKTSTMRLGADAIVFSCSTRGNQPTRSIGLLSYTYLTKTMKNDIIVPMVDFEIAQGQTVPLVYGSEDDWKDNLKIILDWSPFLSENELMMQFKDIGSHGTKIFVYNLWYDDDGLLELDFDGNDEDIRLSDRAKGGGKLSVRNEIIQSHISYTYRYSLRAYVSILYLKKFTNFHIILRGKPVQHLDIVEELKFSKIVPYRPFVGKDESVKATIGFTKEAPILGNYGLNIYHKNRLIKPFWKVVEEAGVRGKCVVGFLEANFIEPAHDKQDFERSPLFNRLETKLKQVVCDYWKTHCHLIGYQPRCKEIRNKQKQSNDTPEAGQMFVGLSPGSRQPYPAEEPILGPVPNHRKASPQVWSLGLAANYHQEQSHIIGSGAVNRSAGQGVDAHPVNEPSVLVDLSCEESESIGAIDSSLIEKISKENVKLSIKREEYIGRQKELKNLIEKLETELAETKRKCATLSSELEIRKLQKLAG